MNLGTNLTDKLFIALPNPNHQLPITNHQSPITKKENNDTLKLVLITSDTLYH